MAQYLSTALKNLACAAVLLPAIAICGAQSLPDPTQPPAALNAPQERAGSKAPAGPELQSVLISPSRKVAIISGQSVKLGDKYGEARVVRITETEVALRNGSDMQVLRLYPSVEKRANPGAAKAGDNRQP